MSREANITPRLLSFKYLFFVWLVRSVSPSLTFFIQSMAFWCPYKYISQVFPVHTLLPYLLVYQWLYIVPKNLKVAQTGKKTFVNSMVRIDHIFINQYISINCYGNFIALVLVFMLAVQFFLNEGKPRILVYMKSMNERIKQQFKVFYVVLSWTGKKSN